MERFGRIDLHHLNAGIPGTLAPLPDVPTADFDRVLAVNVRGMFLGLRAAFRQFAAQGGGGAIVTTGSIASLRGSADLFAYHASKHAVVGMTRSAAVYGGPLGVRVNAVAPGIIPTDAVRGRRRRGRRWQRHGGPRRHDARCAARGRRRRSRPSWPSCSATRRPT